MKQLNLDEIKKCELDLLIQFDKICKQNNLYYTLAFGTLLGAIRHKGFIPWDDDIDVMMPRPDYERLLSGQGIDYCDMPDYMEFVNWKNGKMQFPFIKLIDDRVVIESTFQQEEECIDKVWIDIFPVDGNPEDKNELRRFYRKVRFLRKLQCLKTAKAGQGTTSLKKKLKPLFIKLLKPVDGVRLCNHIDREAKRYRFSTSRYVGNVLWGFTPRDRIDKKAYMKAIDVEFEGHRFVGPSNYHEYLRGLYGNYMQLPPKEKRVTHGFKAYMKEQ